MCRDHSERIHGVAKVHFHRLQSNEIRVSSSLCGGEAIEILRQLNWVRTRVERDFTAEEPFRFITEVPLQIGRALNLSCAIIAVHDFSSSMEDGIALLVLVKQFRRAEAGIGRARSIGDKDGRPTLRRVVNEVALRIHDWLAGLDWFITEIQPGLTAAVELQIAARV